MKFLSSLLLGAAMVSSSASAAIFSYITESKPIGTTGDADYTFIIERWDDEPRGTLNPCYGAAMCNLSVNHKHTTAGTPGGATLTIGSIRGYQYMWQVQEFARSKVGFPIGPMIAQHRGMRLQSNQECVGLFYETGSQRGGLLPGSLCGIAPPPVGACRINNNIPDINFGSVDEASLNGQMREVTVSVACNLPMSVLVIASGTNNGRVRLRNDNSLNASLFLGPNNRPGEVGQSLYVPGGGTSTVQLKARLDTSGRVAPGAFNGAASLILTMP